MTASAFLAHGSTDASLVWCTALPSPPRRSNADLRFYKVRGNPTGCAAIVHWRISERTVSGHGIRELMAADFTILDVTSYVLCFCSIGLSTSDRIHTNYEFAAL